MRQNKQAIDVGACTAAAAATAAAAHAMLLLVPLLLTNSGLSQPAHAPTPHTPHNTFDAAYPAPQLHYLNPPADASTAAAAPG
jgi:hypothetical protein